MKPLKLTMQAFGSYVKPGTIDFEKPEQNLFLITGDTGAGKTTIFDAIVFALYGEASSGTNKKSGNELQSQYAKPELDPFVELTFSEGDGASRQVYTVRRTPRHIRPLKRGTGTKEEKETVSLILPNQTEFSQNKKETDEKLVEILGLTKGQFMQVAMIAQGEFMELLRAKSDEKKVIFRKLFNTEPYQKIVEELGQRRKEKQQEIRDLKKYFNRSVPQLRSKFAGNLLYGRIQGKGVVKEQAESLNLTIEKYIVCVGRKVVGENKIHTGDKWIEEFACINIFEEIFNDFGIHVLSDYNTATAEYNFILLFEKEEENAVCMEKALQACSKIQVEVERYLKAHMNFGLSDVEVDEYQANAQYRKAQTACRQCVYLGTNIILRYEDLQYKKQTDFVITSGEKTHFMMTLFQDSFEKAEDELHQIFRNAPEDVSPVKFAAMDV